jgi:hypothetical protein
MAKWLSYKTIGLVYGSALLIWAVSSFYSWKNIQSMQREVKRAEWVSAINAAVDIGKISACSEGGVCTIINGKQIRLDK